MASQQQLEANRRNARLSTGPKTPEGKGRRQPHPTRHGLASSRARARSLRSRSAAPPGHPPARPRLLARLLRRRLRQAGPLREHHAPRFLQGAPRAEAGPVPPPGPTGATRSKLTEHAELHGAKAADAAPSGMWGSAALPRITSRLSHSGFDGGHKLLRAGDLLPGFLDRHNLTHQIVSL